jgi:hypothetical protein
MELVSPEGHNLNESDMLTWFYNALKRASKIPFQRFDKENGGGNLFSDASEMTRDEIKFYNFINRLRANFKELIVKPIKLQMLIEFPELKDDEIIACDYCGAEYRKETQPPPAGFILRVGLQLFRQAFNHAAYHRLPISRVHRLRGGHLFAARAGHHASTTLRRRPGAGGGRGSRNRRRQPRHAGIAHRLGRRPPRRDCPP